MLSVVCSFSGDSFVTVSKDVESACGVESAQALASDRAGQLKRNLNIVTLSFRFPEIGTDGLGVAGTLRGLASPPWC